MFSMKFKIIVGILIIFPYMQVNSSDLTQKQQFLNSIVTIINKNWIKPSDHGKRCVVEMKLNNYGVVTNLDLSKCLESIKLLKSVISAINKSMPFNSYNFPENGQDNNTVKLSFRASE